MNQSTILGETRSKVVASNSNNGRLPIGGLLALAMVAFITLMTEIMPAGLLSSIAQGLQVTESLAGQFITAFAVGALIAAIPVMLLTRGLRRRPLLLSAIFGFAVVNFITAISDDYTLSMIARLFSGFFGGIVWSMLTGYAVRMSPPHLRGRAIAITSTGLTIALVFGVPLANFIGRIIGWQGAFGMITVVALLLMLWVIAAVPDFPGLPKAQRQSLIAVFLRRGVRGVLFVAFTFVIAHNILYIYIEPLLAPANLAEDVGTVLLLFGLGVTVSLWCVAARVDRWPKSLAVIGTSLFICAALLLAFYGDNPTMVYCAIIIWGFAFGGFSTITQSALSCFAQGSVDTAQSIYTTNWNIAVTIAGIAGGMMLNFPGITSFAWIVCGLLLASLLATIFAMNRMLVAMNR